HARRTRPGLTSEAGGRRRDDHQLVTEGTLDFLAGQFVLDRELLLAGDAGKGDHEFSQSERSLHITAPFSRPHFFHIDYFWFTASFSCDCHLRNSVATAEASRALFATSSSNFTLYEAKASGVPNAFPAVASLRRSSCRRFRSAVSRPAACDLPSVSPAFC